MRAARHIPNAVTMLRLACGPATVWLISRADIPLAFWLFVAASLTDAVDGALARLLGAKTALGSYLDAFADKVLLVGTYLSLGVLGLVSWWLVALVVGRDLALVGMATRLRLAGVQTHVKPLMVSKINTVAQILLAAVVLGQQGMRYFPGHWVPLLSGVVAVTTAVSGWAYVRAWRGAGDEGRGRGERERERGRADR